MADVFISYSKAYAEAAEELARDLQAKGFSVWWDTSLAAGDRFADTICESLRKRMR
jgi:TIR domain